MRLIISVGWSNQVPSPSYNEMLAGLPVAQRRQASEAGCLIIALNLRSDLFYLSFRQLV